MTLAVPFSELRHRPEVGAAARETRGSADCFLPELAPVAQRPGILSS